MKKQTWQILPIESHCFFSQAAWCLKTRALTEQVYVDEIEVDEEGIAEVLMDDNSMAQLPSKQCHRDILHEKFIITVVYRPTSPAFCGRLTHFENSLYPLSA